MAQVSFDFLGVDNTEPPNELPIAKDNTESISDEDIIQQLETFGYAKTTILSAMSQIQNKHDINAIIDHIESPNQISRSSSISNSSNHSNSYSHCTSTIEECPSFATINDLIHYYTKIASKTDTDLNDIFEYANFTDSNHNYYLFVSSFHHIIFDHLDTPQSIKVSFTQTLIDNLSELETNDNVIARDMQHELRKIHKYLDELKPSLSVTNKKTRVIGNTLKTISKSGKNALKHIEVKQKFTKIVEHCKDIKTHIVDKKHSKSKHKHPNSMQSMKPDTQQQIIAHLQSVLLKYETTQQQPISTTNDTFYVMLDKRDQDKFDHFIMDENTKCGRIMHGWLKYIDKYRGNIKFDDLSDFIQKLSHTFMDFYALPKKYAQCVMVLCYRCVLRLNVVKDLIYELLRMSITQDVSIYDKEYQAVLKLDDIYQKKVMWMRVLNRKQLGIKDDYWIQNNVSIKMQSKERRRVSKIGLFAGSDVPYAKGINLLGELEVDADTVDKYVSHKTARDKIKSNGKSKAMGLDRLLHINKNKNKAKPVVSVSFDYEDKDGEEQNEENEDTLPYNLPHLGLNTLLSAVKGIYETALQYYLRIHPHKKEDSVSYMISQDDLFPITLYCIIQSRLETPNKWIYFIEHLLPKDSINFGQAAFALSGLKAAVSYILDAKPQAFGLDNEIELD